MGVSAAPALAAAPEPPEALAPSPLFATAATLHGVVDPKLVGGPGTFELLTYDFLYRESKTECKGGSTVPIPAGMSLGEGDEALPGQEIHGLKPSTEYTVCLRVSGAEGETLSPRLTFKTAAPVAPETPTLTVESPVHSTEAVLHGVLDPAAVAPSEAGAYEFLYKKESPTCTGESTAPASPVVYAGMPEEPVSGTLTGLTPNTKYTVCLRAENAAKEVTVGPPMPFETALPPETPETVELVEAKGASLKVKGVLNPKASGNAGSFEFIYKKRRERAGLRRRRLGWRGLDGSERGARRSRSDRP